MAHCSSPPNRRAAPRASPASPARIPNPGPSPLTMPPLSPLRAVPVLLVVSLAVSVAVRVAGGVDVGSGVAVAVGGRAGVSVLAVSRASASGGRRRWTAPPARSPGSRRPERWRCAGCARGARCASRHRRRRRRRHGGRLACVRARVGRQAADAFIAWSAWHVLRSADSVNAHTITFPWGSLALGLRGLVGVIQGECNRQ